MILWSQNIKNNYKELNFKLSSSTGVIFEWDDELSILLKSSLSPDEKNDENPLVCEDLLLKF